MKRPLAPILEKPMIIGDQLDKSDISDRLSALYAHYEILADDPERETKLILAMASKLFRGFRFERGAGARRTARTAAVELRLLLAKFDDEETTKTQLHAQIAHEFNMTPGAVRKIDDRAPWLKSYKVALGGTLPPAVRTAFENFINDHANYVDND